MDHVDEATNKVAGAKEPRLHPNDTTHNVDDLDLIMTQLRDEARELNIEDPDGMDRNELIEAVGRARRFRAPPNQPLDNDANSQH